MFLDRLDAALEVCAQTLPKLPSESLRVGRVATEPRPNPYCQLTNLLLHQLAAFDMLNDCVDLIPSGAA
jgi:hypothetical protein